MCQNERCSDAVKMYYTSDSPQLETVRFLSSAGYWAGWVKEIV